MFKKIMIALVIALVVGVGILGVVNTTYAQDDDVNSEAVTEPEQATVETENQFGEMVGEAIPNRMRLRELQDGECTGECDPQQLRQYQSEEKQAIRQEHQQQRLENGECTGECVPQQQRLNNGVGNQGQMQQRQQNLNDGECPYGGEGQMRQQGGKGN